MAANISELVVFMASPSDLADEREAIRGVVDQVNTLFADNGLRFRAVGWESTLPNIGRPQSLINPDVDRSDLFIGLLKNRWGSETGEFTSGFEEEYSLALSRHKKSGSPTIHLFFSKLTDHQLDDPGEKLKRVLAFKSKVASEREALYREFSNTSDLSYQILTLLSARGLEELQSTKIENSGNASESSQVDTETMQPIKLDDARDQMSEALSKFTAIIRGQTDDDFAFDQDRVELSARAFGRDKHFVGSHIANRLYNRRDELHLAVGEAELWLRSLLADIGTFESESRTLPGWAVLSDGERPELETVLDLAASDEILVARGAVKALVESGLKPVALFPRNLDLLSNNALDTLASRWSNILNANGGATQALDLFLKFFNPSLELTKLVIETGTLDANTADLLRAARAALNGDPSQLATEFRVLSKYQAGNSELRKLLSTHLDQVSNENLIKMIGRAKGSDLTGRVLEILLERGLASSERVEKIVDWDDESHISTLIRYSKINQNIVPIVSGGPGSELRTKSRTYRARMMAETKSADELRSLYTLDPWDSESWKAALFKGMAPEREAARCVIDASLESLREELGRGLTDRLDVLDFMINERRTDAALLLCRHLVQSGGQSDEAPRERELSRIIATAALSHPTRRESFIDPIGEIIDLEDQSEVALLKPWLTQMADSGYAWEHEELFKSILAEEFYKTSLDSNSATLSSLATTWLAKQSTTDEQVLRDLLHDENSKIRIFALETLTTIVSTEKLLELLSEYPKSGKTYWYNVMVALDSHLFGLSGTTIDQESAQISE